MTVNPAKSGPVPTGADKPAPGLPHTTQVGPKPTVPDNWNDPVNIMRQILDYLEKGGPAAATKLKDFLNRERP